MTQEEEDLLLKDLSARLPYGVKAHYIVHHVIENEYDEWDAVVDDLSDFIHGCKLYLRPMSSMTEEEMREYLDGEYTRGIELFTIPNPNKLDWLNAHHFDYRGLISKGLAIEAPEGMYNNNKE